MIILGVSLKQNLNFKIQMLAGNILNSFLNSSSEENSTLAAYVKFEPFSYSKKGGDSPLNFGPVGAGSLE